MFEIFAYHFIIRGLIAGLAIGIIAPLVGIFLVLRRYSLIADTLSHVSLAGIALGLLLGVNPFFSIIATVLTASLFIERLRTSKRVYGESALAIFLSGSLALSLVLIGFGNGYNASLFSYLFGSITTVKQSDLVIILTLGTIVSSIIILLFKELVYISFDEETASVSGIPTKFINNLFILLAALTVAISIPVVGILLLSALIVIPVVTALQLRKSFLQTLIFAEVFSVSSIILGILLSFYFNLPSGAAIVLTSLGFFSLTYLLHLKR